MRRSKRKEIRHVMRNTPRSREREREKEREREREKEKERERVPKGTLL